MTRRSPYPPLADTFGAIVDSAQGAALPAPADIMSLVETEGVVLLRGFLADTDAFIDFSGRCCADFSRYIGGGIRFRALDREDLGAGGTLMSTTGKTQSFAIPLHGEMYYQKDRPDIVWFYCNVPPAQGGQTTVADGVEILSRLSPEARRLLRSQRLRYIRELERNDWATSFKTDSVDELRRLCDENAMSLEVLADGSARIEYLAAAIHDGPNASETFINSAILLWQFERGLREGSAARVLGGDMPARPPLVVRFEDGTELPEVLMGEVSAVAKGATVDVNWQKSDTLIVDNRRIMHGRRKAGDERQILVRLGYLQPTAVAA